MIGRFSIILTLWTFLTIQEPSMAKKMISVDANEFVVQEIRDIDDACSQMAIDYSQVSQNLHAFKRDYYIVISFIVIFAASGIITCYIVKRRRSN